MTLFFTLLLVILCYFHSSISYDVINCGSHYTFEDVQIENCDPNNVTCKLVIGSSVIINFTLSTGEFDIDDEIINDVGLQIRGGPKISLNVTPENICEVLPCPLDRNYTTDYLAVVEVKQGIPPLANTDLLWVMKTKAGERLLCFYLPVVVMT